MARLTARYLQQNYLQIRRQLRTLPELDSALHTLLGAVQPQLLQAALAENQHQFLKEGVAVQAGRVEMGSAVTLTLMFHSSSPQPAGKRTTRVIHSHLIHSFNDQPPALVKARYTSPTAEPQATRAARARRAQRSSGSRGRRKTAS